MTAKARTGRMLLMLIALTALLTMGAQCAFSNTGSLTPAVFGNGLGVVAPVEPQSVLVSPIPNGAFFPTDSLPAAVF